MADERLSLSEHLEELRLRLIYSVIFFVTALVVCFIFQEKILEIIVAPHLGATESAKLWPINYPERFLVYFKGSLIAALLLSGPFILYQFWQFMSAGLYPHEKKYVNFYLPFSILLFIAGILFCYFILLPPMLKFLASYGNADFLENKFTLNSYFNLFITLIIILGVVFELPLVMLFLTQIKLLTPQFYLKNFKISIIVAFIVAAIITPSSDPVNQTLLAVPLLLLYIIGKAISFFYLRLNKKKTGR